ncbi:PfkB family carbohydrate kinase [Clostridia bacterium OttesenSCG-928-F22]|nr:PfkB family carbohydrate kinase [Clostridia bacterium OttesenSCG-928-F22]
MSKKWDILGVGSSIADIIVQVESMPGADQPAPMLAYSRQGGGMMATAIVAAARLGAKCNCISTIGDDPRGQFCLEDYRRHGISTEHVRLLPGKDTIWSVSVACLDNQTRNLLTYRENAARVLLADLDEGLIAASRFLHVYDQAEEAREVTKKAAQMAKKHGTKVSVDGFRYVPFYDEMLQLADIWIVSELYFRQKFGNEMAPEDAVKQLYESGPEIAIITLGKEGLVGCDENGVFRLPSFKVAVQDTTGAGDVFHGAFLAMAAKGMDYRECARYASATSAIKCTRMGGRAAIPDFGVLQRFVQTGEIDYSEIDERVALYRKL